MKFRIVLDVLGKLLILLGLLILIPALVATIYREPLGVIALGLTSLVAVISGMLMRHYGISGDVTRKEAFAIVAFGWILATFFGALPFMFLGLGTIDSFFESMSGFTTTGATVLTEYNSDGYWVLNSTATADSLASHLETIVIYAITDFDISRLDILIKARTEPVTFYGLLFWRSFTQLLGGMSIILLFIAILPILGVAGRQLYYVDTSREALTPRVKNTARIYWEIYLGFVVLQTAFLWLAGMPLFDSMCTSFTTISTAGYSPLAEGIAAYNSMLIELIVMLFMIVGATSFILHYRLLYKRNIFAYIKDPEFLLFMFFLASASIIVVFWGDVSGDLFHRIRLASFHVVSIGTTTGFTNNFEYDQWSSTANLVIILLMLIGGCAGATAGGIKVIRMLLVLKFVRRELTELVHPKIMRSIRLAGRSVSEDVLVSVLFFVVIYIVIFFGASLALTITESANKSFSLLSSLSAVATCMASVGPGLGHVSFDFSKVSPLGKMIAILCMYIGRLEIMPFLLLFLPDLWEK
jgi:trk system potassium uptake protein TrkH